MNLRRKIVGLLLLGAACTLATKTAKNTKAIKTVKCNKIEVKNWMENLSTCIMNNSIEIVNPDFRIETVDKSVRGLLITRNKMVKYLPIKVSKSFPNLVSIYAASCFIKEIEKANFAKLKDLKYLNLNGNQISKISDDLFEDNTALEWIWLRKYSII